MILLLPQVSLSVHCRACSILFSGAGKVSLRIPVIASSINLVSLVLIAAALLLDHSWSADARHLMTDVWTTGGVLIGIALGINRLCPP
jgi:hypothetical protein